MKTKQIHPIGKGIVVAGEYNDCVIRALANYENLAEGNDVIDSYNKHHKGLSELGRQDCKGTQGHIMMRYFNRLGFKMLYCGNKTKAGRFFAGSAELCSIDYAAMMNCIQMKLSGVVKDLQQGTYIVVTTKHAVCLHNGNLIDTFSNSKMVNVSAVFYH